MNNVRRLTPEHIVRHLPQDFECNADAISSLQVSGSSGRKAFLLNYNDKPSVHLIVGAGLGNVYQRSLGFHSAYPEISAKPLFYIDVEDIGFWGQEHVEGRSLNEARISGKLSHSDADQFLENLFSSLSKGLEQSTEDAAKLEFEEVFETLSRIRYFPHKDLHLISEYVRPIIYESLSHYKLRRWSNGDMHGGNILIKSDGKPVLIDCEFAHNTHFFDEDWFRLKTFSSPSVAKLNCVEKKFEELPIEIRVYHWLRQIILTRSILSGRNYLRCAIVDLAKCIKTLSSSKKSNSILLNSLLFSSQFNDEEFKLIDGYNLTIRSLKSEYNKLANEQREQEDLNKKLKTKLEELQKTYHREIQDRRKIESEIDRIKSAYEAEVRTREEIHGKFDEAYAAYQMEESLRQELEGKLSQLSEIHNHGLGKLSKITEQLESSHQLLDEQKISNTQLVQELKNLEKELESGKIAYLELQNQHKSLQAAYADLTILRRELEDTNQTLEKNFHVEQESRRDLESALSDSTIKIQALKSKICFLESDLKSVERELEMQKEKIAGLTLLNNKQESLLNNSVQNLRLLEPNLVD